MTPRIDQVEAPEIGKFYMVPCVQFSGDSQHFSWHDVGEWIPVLLPLHTDDEIGVKALHWHYDYRFFSLSKYNYFSERQYSRAARILHADWNGKPQVTSYIPTYRRLKYKRTPNRVWPTVARIHVVLEEKYKQAKVKNHICPHRGVSMAGCIVEVGKRICPAHGLVWDAETGELITGELAALHRRDQAMQDAFKAKL